MGFHICAARNPTFQGTGTATYLAAANFSDNCSIDANTGFAPAALILNHNRTGNPFFPASKCLAAERSSETARSEKRRQTVYGAVASDVRALFATPDRTLTQ